MKRKIQKQINKLIEKYYHFFDKKLDNSTITVGLIGLFIFSVGISFGGGNSDLKLGYMKSNLLETNSVISYKVDINQNVLSEKSGVVNIGGKKYRILLEEIRKNVDNSNF